MIELGGVCIMCCKLSGRAARWDRQLSSGLRVKKRSGEEEKNTSNQTRAGGGLS